jgi:hypothetical protein
MIDTGPFHGEPEDGFGAPEKLSGTASITRTVRFRTALTEESITQALVEDDTITSIASNIAAKLQAPLVGEVSASLKSDISKTLRREFRSTFSITQVEEREWEESRKLEINFDSEVDQVSFVVRGYSRCQYELWLGFIDYLHVVYEGVRKRRLKLPLVEGNRHNNVISLKLPAC